MKFSIKTSRIQQTRKINAVLPDVIDSFDFGDSFIIEALREGWTGLAGEIIASHSRPDRIFKKTLFIAVDHSAFAGELSLMKDTLLGKINEQYSLGLVSLKTEVKKIRWS